MKKSLSKEKQKINKRVLKNKISLYFGIALLLLGQIGFIIFNPETNFLKADTTISSSTSYTSNTTTNDNVIIANGATLTLTGGITWTINGNLTVQNGGFIVFQETGGTYTSYPTLSVSGNITVDSGGTIHSNSKGFTGGAVFTDGTGTGKGTTGSNSVGGGGAGHGGAGGNGYGASNAGIKYGSTLAPVTAGSGGGGGGASGGATGGAGGGVVRIDSGGTVTVNGTVAANGGNGGDAGSTGGGGAGGSIYITATGLDGTGSLTATGGRGGNNTGAYQAGGGGGGGRIATYFNTPGASIATLKAASSVLGGVGGDGPTTSDGKVGQVGTLFFLDVDNRDIDIYNGPDFFQEGDTVTLSGTQTTFTGTPKFGDSDATTNDNDAVFDNANSTTQFDDITIAADAYVESKIASGNTIFNLSINYTGILTITSPTSTDGSCRSFTATTSQDASFDTCFVVEQVTLTGPTLTINTNAQLYADGYGNTGGAAFANGNGTGGGVYGANVSGGGGGHGGAGGNGSGSGATGGIAHGSNTAPVTAGSGGGGGSATSGAIGGNGGGIIRLTLSSTATVNGTITADGTNGADSGRTGGGGSGGSIYLTVPGTFAGNGSLTATGGRGGNSGSYPAGGGGGGGRIAYYYVTLTYSGSATVTAGIGGDGTGASDGVAGSNGTTYTYQYGAPSTPSITSPSDSATGVSRSPTLTSSAFSGDLSHTSSNWQISTTSNFATIDATISTDTTNLTSIGVNSTNFTFQNNLVSKTILSPSTTYYAKTQHTNAAGTSSWSTVISFTTTTNTVPNTPSISSPSNGATNQSRTVGLTSSAFSDSDSDTHTSSTWEIATDSGFTNIVASKSNDTSNKTSITVNSTNFTFQGALSGKTTLQPATTYYIRVSYKDSENGSSSTSTAVSFTTIANNAPDTPSISSPSNGATNQSRTVGLTSSAFSDSDSDTHTSSTWEIATDSGFTNIVASKSNDTSNKTSITVNSTNFTFQGALSGKTTLQPATTYYIRVSYKDSENGSSSTSTAVSFTTIANNAPDTPSISSPSNGATNQSRTVGLTSSAFSDSDSDTHTSSTWEIATDSGFTNIVATKSNDTSNKTSITVNSTNLTFQGALSGKTELLPSTTYYTRVSYTDSENGTSSTSSAISFTTETNATPSQPSISSPSNGATNQARNQLVSGSSFSDADPDDTHQSSDWEVYGDTTLTTLAASLYDSTSNKTSVAITSSNLTFQNALSGKELLDPETTYYVRVRYTDSENQDSNWSNAISFTTGTNVAPTKPSITTPSSGATETSTTLTLQSSAFSDVDDTQHISSSWEVYNSSSLGNSNLVWQKLSDTTNKTSITVNNTNGAFSNSLNGRTKLLPGITYYARMLQSDAASADSDWSDAVTFTTVTPPATPTLSSSSHTSETDYFKDTTPDFTVSVGTPTPNHYHYLVNQTASPTLLQVEAGASDTDGTFTVPDGTINANGTWYAHIVSHDVNDNPSATFYTYTIKYDNAAPTISSVASSNIAANSTDIIWNSLNSSNSRVDYGTVSGIYTLVGSSSTSTKSHSITLNNLQAGITYYYKTTSIDGYSQTDVSTEGSFTTLASTIISNVTATNISETSTTITWTTNHPATSKVNYGLSTAYGLDIQNTELVTSHSIQITNLTPGITYYYEIISVGNSTATDAYHTFDTVGGEEETVEETEQNETPENTGESSGSSSGSSGVIGGNTKNETTSQEKQKSSKTETKETETEKISSKNEKSEKEQKTTPQADKNFFQFVDEIEKQQEKQRDELKKGIKEKIEKGEIKQNGEALKTLILETIKKNNTSNETLSSQIVKLVERKTDTSKKTETLDTESTTQKTTESITKDWATPYIEFLEDTGFIENKKEIEGSIHASVSRCELSKTIAEFFYFESDNTSISFSDLKKENECSKHVNALQKIKAIEGYKDKTFKPEKTVNRAEALKIITIAVSEYFHLNFRPEDYNKFANPFFDVPDDAWYSDYVKFAFNTKSIIGYPDKTFKPEKEISLAEVSKILVHLTAYFDDVIGEKNKIILPNESVSEKNQTDSLFQRLRKLLFIPRLF